MKDIKQTAIRAKGARAARSAGDMLPPAGQSPVIDDFSMHPGLATWPTATWLFTCAIPGRLIANKRSL